MKISVLVENNSIEDYKSVHGLSFYIETKNHNILFDVGPDDTIFYNASLANIDLCNVDIVIISHGHKDHGGALKEFLSINSNAVVYIQRNAFNKHFSNYGDKINDISLDIDLMNHKQVILLDGDYKIDNELSLFCVKNKESLITNDNLYSYNNLDTFTHEQNLIINETTSLLMVGCAHSGIVNILNETKHFNIRYCFGGFHLANRIKSYSNGELDSIINKLNEYNYIDFYTCHCTGLMQFKYMSGRMFNLFYIKSGDIINL